MKVHYKISLILSAYFALFSIFNLLEPGFKGYNVIQYITPFLLAERKSMMMDSIFSGVSGLLILTVSIIGYTIFIISRFYIVTGLQAIFLSTLLVLIYRFYMFFSFSSRYELNFNSWLFFALTLIYSLLCIYGIIITQIYKRSFKQTKY